jgi:hypothetical protein
MRMIAGNGRASEACWRCAYLPKSACTEFPSHPPENHPVGRSQIAELQKLQENSDMRNFICG